MDELLYEVFSLSPEQKEINAIHGLRSMALSFTSPVGLKDRDSGWCTGRWEMLASNLEVRCCCVRKIELEMKDCNSCSFCGGN